MVDGLHIFCENIIPCIVEVYVNIYRENFMSDDLKLIKRGIIHVYIQVRRLDNLRMSKSILKSGKLDIS